MLVNAGRDLATFQVKRHARHQHAIEKALEDRRRPEAPCGRAQNQALGSQQPLHIPRDRSAISRCVVVVATFLGAHHGVEALGVEVAVIDLVATFVKGIDHCAMQSGVGTILQRMREDHHDPHGTASGGRRRGGQRRMAVVITLFAGAT
jgi:hypothetical protein